ncbi:hypothetical protein ACGFI9_10910 [Micromonospora sp. NPDC048930]|uniref:hypothetical protein n=1 Tax=Micromonospora sp. NPDC048930 TaxID=3364261 RepID=UPI00371AD933
MIAITIFIVFATISAVVSDFSMGGSIGSALGILVGLAVLGLVIYLIAAMSWVFLTLAVRGAWLRGSVLIERRLVRRFRVDLQTARVELREADAKGAAEMRLVATDPETGASQELLIGKGDAVLPSQQLKAIADAIVVGRQNVAEDHSAIAVADRLRQLTDRHQSADRR